MKRLLVLAGFFLLAPQFVEAQSRGLVPAPPAPVVAAPRAIPHAGPSAGTRAAPRTHAAARTPGIHPHAATTNVKPTHRLNNPQPRVPADQPVINSDFSPVPGLGFDVPHLAATRGPGAVEPRRHGRSSMAFFPFFNGGFFLPATSFIEEAPVTETQQAENTQVETPETTPRVRAQEETAIPATYVEAAARDAEEYVFVRRNGTVFFAVAYVWENGTLRYVTKEGLRRSVARDTLDLDATQQFNEQRGLNFRVPA
jgi:hypothetical protein